MIVKLVLLYPQLKDRIYLGAGKTHMQEEVLSWKTCEQVHLVGPSITLFLLIKEKISQSQKTGQLPCLQLFNFHDWFQCNMPSGHQWTLEMQAFAKHLQSTSSGAQATPENSHPSPLVSWITFHSTCIFFICTLVLPSFKSWHSPSSMLCFK